MLIAPVISNAILILAAIVFVTIAAIGWPASTRGENQANGESTRGGPNQYSRIIGIGGLILLLGIWRFQTVAKQNNISQFYNHSENISGVIIEEPDVRPDKIYLTVGDLMINNKPIFDKLLVSVYDSRNFAYGDRISFTGKILQPAVFDDFDYQGYLSRFGIDGVVYYPNPEVVAANQGNHIKATLLKVKQNFIANINRVLPDPTNAFLGGILVGNKRQIPQNLIDAFNATSTSHVIAISGYNITIIVWGLDLLFRRFGKKISSLISILAIVAFIILTGGSASVIRAGLMGGLAIIALNIGRLNDSQNALILTAAGMIAINPKILQFDVGFQLSFLALAGLVYLEPVFEYYCKRWPAWIRATLLVTLAAQIFTLPILLYNFGQLSVIGPLTNVLALPLVPFAMGFGFATGLIGFIWQPLANLIAWPTYWLLELIIKIIEWTAHLPYSNFTVHFNLLEVGIYYGILIALLIWFTKNKKSSNLSKY